MSSVVNEAITEKLRGRLGNPVVLLQIGYGQKAPITKGWQSTTVADCDEVYLRSLDSGKYNIGVLLGTPSGGLCSIDIDDEADIEPFLKRNPALRTTLRTRGRRGCNLWVRIDGEYPSLSKIKSTGEANWGEWRADGGQTVIFGRHPEGMDYQILVDEPVVNVAFEDIDWGGLNVPWLPESEAADTSARDTYLELVKEHGDPLQIPERGMPKLNQYFFLGRFAIEHRVLHEPAEREFYLYEGDRGLWVRCTTERIKDLFAMDLKAFSDAAAEKRILFLRNNSVLGSLAELLRGHVEQKGVFSTDQYLIHLANGMLHLDCDPPELRGFSPDYFSRNQCPYPLIEGADCPRFVSELLEPALEQDDIDLLQRWAGSLLLGGNAAQKIFLITGTPGGGKSTLLEIFETILGLENIRELRTDHLHERFEQQFFIGKTLLTGKDVPGNFLQRRGASMLKKLVGGDVISPEKKGSNDVLLVRGNFNVAITANSRLQVRLDGDADAWRRRLVVIRYERPKPKERIPEFAKMLLEEEGSGILNWMLVGAVRHLMELKDHGDFVMTDRQHQRVDDLLAESDSVRAFVQNSVEVSAMEDLSTDELVRAYREYCEEKEWDPMTKRQVENQLPDLMMEFFGVTKSHKICRGGGTVRGYNGITINEHD